MREFFDVFPGLAYPLLMAIVIFVWALIYGCILEYRKRKEKQYEELAESQRETVEKAVKSAWKTSPSVQKSWAASSKSSSIHGAHREKTNNIYDKIDRISVRCCNCSTPESAQKCVDQLYSIQTDLEIDGASAYLKSYLASEIRDAEENVRFLKRCQWEEKAQNILTEFENDFLYVTDEDDHDFRHIEDILKAKQRCINSWRKYWLLLDQFDIEENLHEYLKKYLGGSFDPCMQSGESLRKRLDAATEKLKPENKRKKQIYSDIVQYVSDHDGIMRCELLKHKFKNATDKEVQCCYKDLVKKYRLVETKIGSRYFVSLSDNERKKNSQT